MSNEQLYLDSLDDIEKRFKEMSDIHLDEIVLDNKTLASALKSQVNLQLAWESLKNRVSYLYNSIENDVEEAYAAAISVELKDGYKSTTISEAREFAKCNQNYKTFKRLLNECKLLKDEISGILDVIQSRKYILNNMTNSVVAGVDGHII